MSYNNRGLQLYGGDYKPQFFISVNWIYIEFCERQKTAWKQTPGYSAPLKHLPCIWNKNSLRSVYTVSLYWLGGLVCLSTARSVRYITVISDPGMWGPSRLWSDWSSPRFNIHLKLVFDSDMTGIPPTLISYLALLIGHTSRHSSLWVVVSPPCLICNLITHRRQGLTLGPAGPLLGQWSYINRVVKISYTVFFSLRRMSQFLHNVTL